MVFSVSGHSLLKDVVVAFSVLVATVGCWVAVLQKRKAKEQMERMMKDMKILQQAEDGLQELQTRYNFFLETPSGRSARHLLDRSTPSHLILPKL